MTKKERTNAFLAVLGAVTVGVLGYFAWIFLVPPETAKVPVSPAVELQSEVVDKPSFRGLYPYADLPVKVTNVGRPDPFAPLATEGANSNTDANSNVNGTGTGAPEGNASGETAGQ